MTWPGKFHTARSSPPTWRVSDHIPSMPDDLLDFGMDICMECKETSPAYDLADPVTGGAVTSPP
jgi:hypothetical protein